MRRIILSVIIALGIHIALMIFIPTKTKKDNKIVLPRAKAVMVTLSYRQPIFKEPVPLIKQIEKIKPKPEPVPEPKLVPEPKTVPKKTNLLTPKKKTRPVLKKKNLTKQNKPVIHKPTKHLTPVEPSPVKAKKHETSKTNPVKQHPLKNPSTTFKKTKPQNDKTIKQAKIKFAKPLYKKNSSPVYPRLAKRRGYVGTVELLVLVSKKGKVTSLKIFKSSGHKSLDNQAVKTVKDWQFEPGKKNGTPQEMWVKIPVKFSLK